MLLNRTERWVSWFECHKCPKVQYVYIDLGVNSLGNFVVMSPSFGLQVFRVLNKDTAGSQLYHAVAPKFDFCYNPAP